MCSNKFKPFDKRHKIIKFESTINNNSFKIKRCLEVDKEKNPKFKFQELLEWDKRKKMAVCIGFNPALAQEKIDTTNERLIKLLDKKEYGSYLLMNLYPEITSSSIDVDLSKGENENFLSSLITKLDDTKGDIVLFWGRTVPFDETIKKFIEKNINRISITVHQYKKGKNAGFQLFIHPGSNSSIELKKLEKSNIHPLLKSYKIF